MSARRFTAWASTVVLATLMAAPVAPAAGAAPDESREATKRTRLTFTVADCEGCKVQLEQARRTSDGVRVWHSRLRTVRDGRVTFWPATPRTHGMSVAVRAPWEGHTGYTTTVAFRYNGELVGDPMTFEEAVTKRLASACWEGTRRRRVTMPLVVEKVRVRGVHRRVAGSIAFVPTTQSWLPPMRRVIDGVLGSQDVNICR